ncbi:MAG: IS1 family transposase [Chitinophagaceae bacterium]|nr:IS1 family transposase [Chitinophagaceae bacterium]
MERKDLSIRTHLKRLNRKTICFTRNSAVLNIYRRFIFTHRIDYF